MSDQTILVTDATGFIGLHIAQQPLGDGHHILSLGGLNNAMIRP
jgi:nucleoside-diphosphate-sugar epimerase